MKTLFFIIFLMLASLCAQAQSISYIETTKAWHYVYDQNGKKIRTISTSQGQIVAYSSYFYILKQGSSFYVIYDPNGKRLYWFSAYKFGEVIAASGDTFTSRNGSWIYTWDKNGKKINTRTAN